VLAEAAAFGLLAAVSPTALLVMAVFLSSNNPRGTALMYTVGAAVMTVVTAVAVLFLLRAVHLNGTREHDPRYGLRLGLGALALLFCAVLIARRRRARADHPPADGGEGEPRKPGLIGRMTANPRPRSAFVAGLLLFAPGATFIAAVQVVATANVAVPETVVGLAVVIVLSVLTAWLPLVAYLAAPDATTRHLKAANGWLRANSRTIVILVLAVAGVALVVNGALGLS
jgi:threonine/homoserine/homoserine lactone efflux protein